MLYVVLLAAAVLVWVSYCALILWVGVILLGSSSTMIRRIYWIAPVALIGLVLALLYFANILAPLHVRIHLNNWLLVPLVLAAVFTYLIALMASAYIFRCDGCGASRSTYRVWWRRGIYECPACGRRYVKGQYFESAV